MACIPQIDMVCTPDPSVATISMVQAAAPEIDLSSILYIPTTPYKPDTWHCTLSNCNLLNSFTNLVHNISYGSQIGNPPPLMNTILPPNLSSVNIHQKIINQELVDKVLAGYMSWSFTASLHDVWGLLLFFSSRLGQENSR